MFMVPNTYVIYSNKMYDDIDDVNLNIIPIFD